MADNTGVEIIAIAALGKKTRAICRDQELLWKIPKDLQRVKDMTMGHPLIMGRKTFASIGKPLPGRTNIIITHNRDFSADGCKITHSLDQALDVARVSSGSEKIYIFGGGEIYRLALPQTTKLELTLVDSDKDGDAHFPEYENEFRTVTTEEGGEHEGEKYTWVTLERVS